MSGEGCGVYRKSLVRLVAVGRGVLVNEVVIWGLGLVVA